MDKNPYQRKDDGKSRRYNKRVPYRAGAHQDRLESTLDLQHPHTSSFLDPARGDYVTGSDTSSRMSRVQSENSLTTTSYFSDIAYSEVSESSSQKFPARWDAINEDPSSDPLSDRAVINNSFLQLSTSAGADSLETDIYADVVPYTEYAYDRYADNNPFYTPDNVQPQVPVLGESAHQTLLPNTEHFQQYQYQPSTNGQDLAQIQAMPRHIPLSQDNPPWSPWNAQYAPINGHSVSDDIFLRQSALSERQSMHRQGAPPKTSPDHQGSNAGSIQNLDLSPRADIQEICLSHARSSSYHESKKSLQDIAQTQSSKRGGRKGRLQPDIAEHARHMRRRRSCWPCAILRETCGSDTVCRRCKPKLGTEERPLCDRSHLMDLTDVFLPEIFSNLSVPDPFNQHSILGLVDGRPIALEITWGFGPNLPIVVMEVLATDASLAMQQQYRLDPETQEYETIHVPSPPIAMRLDESSIVRQRQELNRYLNNILESNDHFGEFLDRCYWGPNNVLQRSIIRLMHHYHRNAPDKIKELPRLSLKLIITTFMMNYALNVPKDKVEHLWNQLSQQPPRALDACNSPKLLTKEVKFLLAELQRGLFKEILKKIEKLLRASNTNKATWVPAFATMIGLALAAESIQVSIRCKAHRNISEGRLPMDPASTTRMLQAIEERYEFLVTLFHEKYRARFKNHGYPVCSADARQDLEDDASKEFVLGMANLLGTHNTRLQELSSLPQLPLLASDRIKEQSGRLLSRFLLSFYQPDQRRYQKHVQRHAEPQ